MTSVNSETAQLHMYPEMTNVADLGEKQMRCNKCNKLLAKTNDTGNLAAEIKCPRCGTMNEL